MVFYSVKAQFIEEKLGELYQKLTDDTIQNQKPEDKNTSQTIELFLVQLFLHVS